MSEVRRTSRAEAATTGLAGFNGPVSACELAPQAGAPADLLLQTGAAGSIAPTSPASTVPSLPVELWARIMDVLEAERRRAAGIIAAYFKAFKVRAQSHHDLVLYLVRYARKGDMRIQDRDAVLLP